MFTIIPTNLIKDKYYKEVCDSVKKALKPFNHLETQIYDNSEQSGYLIVEVLFGRMEKVENLNKANFLDITELPKLINRLDAVNFKLTTVVVRKKKLKIGFIMAPKNSQLLY